MENAHSKGDLEHLQSAVAILVAGIVHTLNESDHTFSARFVKNLELAARKVSDNGEEGYLLQTQVLAWTRELLTGFSQVSGQGKPFFEE